MRIIVPFTTMVELTNSVSMSPAHVRFRCDPEIEAYVDALFREPDGFAHESSDENSIGRHPLTTMVVIARNN